MGMSSCSVICVQFWVVATQTEGSLLESNQAWCSSPVAGTAPPPMFLAYMASPNYDVQDSEDGTGDWGKESVECDKESVESMDLDVDDESFAITEASVYVKHGPLVCTVCLYSVLASTHI